VGVEGWRFVRADERSGTGVGSEGTGVRGKIGVRSWELGVRGKTGGRSQSAKGRLTAESGVGIFDRQRTGIGAEGTETLFGTWAA